MDKNVAMLIVQVAAEEGLNGIELRDGYNGRNMFGRTTTGIVFDSMTDFLRAVAVTGARVAEGDHDDHEIVPSLEAFCEGLSGKTDSMGHGTIVY